jgi:hypothetical protein
METHYGEKIGNLRELPSSKTSSVDNKYFITINSGLLGIRSNRIVVNVVAEEGLLRHNNTCFFNANNELIGLNLMQNGIHSISFISNFLHLERLDLGNNLFSDLSPIRFLNNLTHLDLRGNEISNLSIMKGMHHLRDVNLCRNIIIDIREFDFLNEHETIFISVSENPCFGELAPFKNYQNHHFSILELLATH